MTDRLDTSQPPRIDGVRRSFITARGVRFHVTEAGQGTPVLALHGWPAHHYAYRDLLANPPAGLRIIAPDLPGYGWSGPAPHKWAKQDVADDLIALMDALDLNQVMLLGHDWGAYIGWLMVLGAEHRFSGFIPLAMPHPWAWPVGLRHAWRLAHMAPMATAGSALMRNTPFVEQTYRLAADKRSAITGPDIEWFADRFRDPVCAQASQDTYRTFLTREVYALAGPRERRRVGIPVRTVLGANDPALHTSLASPHTALADDYDLRVVERCGHFVPDERPDVVREVLTAMAAPLAV
ncbi:alpha/beta fold hydrolase [Smaragdicoccus niigatensis]|uniref:alpha/beta fold hydrolase n=1 Tax=Smaragdicoccus niigatensis TaxID=359359 RepID=UPI0003A24E4F|nr:alpha/beta hydrolase [Smaragdicoccus niigatensis]